MGKLYGYIKMYLDLYKIDGAVNIDTNKIFSNPNALPQFQEGLQTYKRLLKELVNNQRSTTIYKFGDGDYRFLRGEPKGSAKPGARALSLPYSQINLQAHIDGSHKCDLYTCEMYPENISMFKSVIDRDINFPAEYTYGLVANKWFTKTFDSIGLIGAKEKLLLIERMMTYSEYKDYLHLNKFDDYIYFPQKFAADNLGFLEETIRPQLEKSTSKIFLLGIGHAKSGILHKFSEWKPNSVFVDVGAGIDMICGCINNGRPFAGAWTNYRIKDYDYSKIDYMNYNHRNEKYL